VRGKQPKLKPNQAKHLLELHDSGITPETNWPNSSASADRRCTELSSGFDPSHQNRSGLHTSRRILRREPTPAGRRPQSSCRVQRAQHHGSPTTQLASRERCQPRLQSRSRKRPSSCRSTPARCRLPAAVDLVAWGTVLSLGASRARPIWGCRTGPRPLGRAS
jgi:hypothetical protein